MEDALPESPIHDNLYNLTRHSFAVIRQSLHITLHSIVIIVHRSHYACIFACSIISVVPLCCKLFLAVVFPQGFETIFLQTLSFWLRKSPSTQALRFLSSLFKESVIKQQRPDLHKLHNASTSSLTLSRGWYHPWDLIAHSPSIVVDRDDL